MQRRRNSVLSRRSVLKRIAATAMLGPLFQTTKGTMSAQVGGGRGINRNSSPSALKIADIRACRISANYDYPLIKVYTNQDVYGLGEVRDAGVEGMALMLKPFLVGQDPTDIEGLLRRIRPYANHGRSGGGYSAIDIALHDITGKVYGVPAWRLLAPHKVRDRVRIYADTTDDKDPKIYASRMQKRKEMGITYFKMDLHTELVAERPNAVDERGIATDKGLGYMCEFIAAIRDVIGWKAPLAADHFGPLNVQESIRYARAFEPYQLAWAEDLLQVREGFHFPWQDWQAYKHITESTTTPTNTGEDIFGLEDGFKPLIENHAVMKIHPDPLTSGALIETKKIADFADANGIPTAVHYAGSPVGCLANVHMIATINNFVAMENHALDMPWWQDLVQGLPKPVINQGYVTVPDTPGIGVELNDEIVKKHLRHPGYFEPTSNYDEFKRMSGGWPHFDDQGKWCDDCESYR